jgi:hypothetical protein
MCGCGKYDGVVPLASVMVDGDRDGDGEGAMASMRVDGETRGRGDGRGGRAEGLPA